MATVTKSTSDTIALVVSTSSQVSIPTSVVVFEGEVDGWSMREGRLTVDIASALSQWSKRTLSKHGASCRWKAFKGTECGYTGEVTWCDRTYTRCEKLVNTANFGGFRYLPPLVDTEVWWGRSPK